MRCKPACRCFTVACLVSAICHGQITLSPNAARVVGHPQLTVSTVNPNLVEGRELYAPQGIAVDAGVTPPILYVSDTGNNRVLAWKNAAEFQNGAAADLVIGQKDKFTTFAQGPGTTFSTGLNSPTGLAVNKGNLYVVDSGNNRILRFPVPFSQADQFPDLVIGQPGFTSNSANAGGAVSENGIFLSAGGTPYRGASAFDASGNLYFVDAGNRRVLRYPGSVLKPGNNGPAADLVLGQSDFMSVGAGPQNQLVKDRFDVPRGLAFDGAGRLYVSDSDPSRPDLVSRVLVFVTPFQTGMAASRVMGVVGQVTAQSVPQSTLDKTVMLDPEGVLMIGGNPAIVDCQSSRILVFDPFEKWPVETSALPSPQAIAVIGQLNNFGLRQPNHGQREPSQSTLALPVAAVSAGTELFVADTGNHRVMVFPQLAGSFGAAARVLGQSDFEFNTVNLIEGREFDFVTQGAQGTQADAGMAIDERSSPPHLYVADPYNNRVLGFQDFRTVRPGTRAELVIGQPDMFRSLCNYPNGDPNKPAQSSLCRPIGLAVDSGGNLWVADSGNGRVLRFPQPFSHLATLTQGELVQADLVLGQADFTTKVIDPTEHTMSAPYGLALVGDTGVLVSDEVYNRVLFFPKPDGGFANGIAAATVLGQPDFTSTAASSSQNVQDNRMNGPRHVASDSMGRVYVADSGNSRVLIFDVIGNLSAADAHPAMILQGQFRNPNGIYVNGKTGEIWVTDGGSNQSLRFPNFNGLVLNNTPDIAIPAANTPLALAQDQFGDLYVADAANRIAIYYPGLAALNGANFLADRPLAPGAIASVYPVGNQFGPEKKSFSDLTDPLPLPTLLGDTQVILNDQPVPLYFVSPTQINFLVPMSAPVTGSAELQIIRKSSGQVMAIGPVSMNAVSPALFTTSGTGNGQVLATNQDPDQKCGKAPTCYINSSTNPAARGSTISLYGTGEGYIPGAPPDGAISQTAVETPQKPKVIIGTRFVDDSDVQYSGLAPGLVGIWQINVTIPKIVAPGNSVPVAVVYGSMPSLEPQHILTTIAVKQ